jgi:predicted nucleic-acid-binding Zn-ribbon protein
MSNAVECIRCHAQMEAGFVADLGEHGFTDQKWCRGEPNKSFWTGLKMKKEDVFPVRTMRCSKCGYLESYALPESISGQ